MSNDFMNSADDPCMNCVANCPCFESEHCPELEFDVNGLLCNIWHFYKLAKSKYTEYDLYFRLFTEFKEELTERYNYLHHTEFSSLDLVQMIVNRAELADNELFTLRQIFGGTGIDLSQLNVIIGAKASTSLYDMKTYDTFYNVFIDRSSYDAFIDSLVHFIFD